MKFKKFIGIAAAIAVAAAPINVIASEAKTNENAKTEAYLTGLSGWFPVDNADYYVDYGSGDLLGIRTDAEEITIPAQVSLSKIYTVELYNSQDCPNLKKLTIPGSMKITLHKYGTDFKAFPVLEEVVISGSNDEFMTSDGMIFSKDKTKLWYYPAGKKENSYTIPSYVKKVEGYAFQYANNLTELIIPDTVTEIGNYAIANCDNLEKIVFPDSVTSFNVLLENNPKLKTIVIGSKANTVDASYLRYLNALENIDVSESNPYITSVDGVVFSKDKTKLIAYPKGRTQSSYTIPDTVKTIGKDAFCGNPHISEIVIPDTVKTIENNAFYGCTSLTNVSVPKTATDVKASAFSDTPVLKNGIPDGVTEIDSIYGLNDVKEITIPATVKTVVVTEDYLGYVPSTRNVFRNLGELEKINVAADNPYLISVDGVLYDKNKTRLIAYPIKKSDNKYEMPDTVTEICGGSFELNKSLEELIMPACVTKIGVDAFKDSNIKKADIPESVTEIDMQAFADCEQLEEVILAGKITQLKESTFYGCKNLKTITLPDTLTSMEWGPFCGCESLTEVELPAGLTNISDSAFKETNSLRKIVIPDSVKDIASTAFRIKIPDTWNSYEQPKSLTIFCNKGSYAEKFAKEEGISFFYIENINIPAINGGANHTGKLEAADSAVILQKVLNGSYKMPIENATDDYLKYIDVDVDGKITASDSTQVMQKVLNNSYKMPVER